MTFKNAKSHKIHYAWRDSHWFSTWSLLDLQAQQASRNSSSSEQIVQRNVYIINIYLYNARYEWQVQGDLDKVIQICDTILQLDPTNLPAFLLQTGYQDKKKPTAVSKDQILIQQNVSKYPNTQLFQEYIAKFADKYPAIYLLFFQFLLSPQITMEQVVECNKYAGTCECCM